MGGIVGIRSESFGPYNFGSATSSYFRANIQARWFDYWLKDKGSAERPEALIFQTGTNIWKEYKAWPPREGVSRRSLYLRAGGKLSFTAPDEAESGKPDRFRSDPSNPVPYRSRPISPFFAQDSSWPVWLADDQAPFARRPDVLFWQTDPLKEDITITGDVAARLFASTTGTDADWVVKLIDVYPADEPEITLRNRQRIIANDVFRGRFRKSYEKPEPVQRHAVLDYDINLHSASHVFKKGHRIAVQIQSSWFPLIDRNPQTFVDNILSAPPSAFQAQTHRVFHGPRYPSAITLGIEGDGQLP